MNIDKIVDKSYEGKSFQEIANAPVSALQGVSEGDAQKLKEAFGIDTVKELAENKFFQAAHAINLMAKYEG